MRTIPWKAAAAALFVAACGDAPMAPQVTVDIQALTLPAVTNAVYELTVTNDVGELVWSRQIDTLTYGDGRGGATYIGTCDASDNDGDGVAINTVAFRILELPPLGPSDWDNPTANGPMLQTVACAENADAAVTFQFAILRNAEQGFFDIAVDFEDIFCSAKLDCIDDFGAPLQLLHDPVTGQRDTTAVLGFACTAGPAANTHLHMDDLSISCASGAYYTVDTAWEGVASGQGGLVTSSLVLRGSESLAGGSKRYWNVAMGLDDTALGANGGHTDCVLRTRATASDGPWANGASPAGVVYPYVDFEVPLNGAGGLSCTQHPMGGGNGVSVVYDTDLSFDHAYSVGSQVP